MADFLGIDIKKLIEFCLSLVIMILFIVAKQTSGYVFIVVVLTFCYLALNILMTLAKRDLGASTPLEAVFGVFALTVGIQSLINDGFDPAERGVASLFNVILGIMFILFMLF